MEMHQVRYLVELANTHSFTRAAALCHVTQPTLSHQIRKLEEEMGEPLFQRNRRGAYLTPLGERLYEHARTILSAADLARQEALLFSKEVRGRIRLGIIPTIAPYFLPGLLETCREKHPGLQFHISESPTQDLVAAMRQGTLDLCILSLPLSGDDFIIRELMQDEFLLALPKIHPLARARKWELSQLRNYPMILMNDAHCLRGQALSLCDRGGFSPQVFIHSSQLDTVMAMVEAGLGISFIPAMARNSFGHRKVIFRALPDETLSRRISLVWPRQLSISQAFNVFVDLCTKSLGKKGGK